MIEYELVEDILIFAEVGLALCGHFCVDPATTEATTECCDCYRRKYPNEDVGFCEICAGCL